MTATVRLSFWVPPDRSAEFQTVHVAKLARLLGRHGLEQGVEPRRIDRQSHAAAALDLQLDRIAVEGIDARYARHLAMAERTRAWVAEQGLTMFGDAHFLSPTVACINAGDLDVADLVQRVRQEGFVIGNGYGPLKGKTFRIGHMGDHSVEMLAQLLAAMS